LSTFPILVTQTDGADDRFQTDVRGLAAARASVIRLLKDFMAQALSKRREAR